MSGEFKMAFLKPVFVLVARGDGEFSHIVVGHDALRIAVRDAMWSDPEAEPSDDIIEMMDSAGDPTHEDWSESGNPPTLRWSFEDGSLEIIKVTDPSALDAAPAPAEAVPLTFTYRNWRGEVAERRVIPLGVRFGSTEWHPEPQWLLRGIDIDKQAEREFALKDIGAPPPTDAEAVRRAAEIVREHAVAEASLRAAARRTDDASGAAIHGYAADGLLELAADLERSLSSQPPATEGWRLGDLVYYENDGCRLKGLFKRMVEGWIEIELTDGSLVISRPSRIKPRQPFPTPPARGGDGMKNAVFNKDEHLKKNDNAGRAALEGGGK